jgi:energy-coupling factor transporter ATP-binding protein EcfA2
MYELEDANYELKQIAFNVDGELSPKVELPFPNKSFFLVIAGRAGSGKTSLLINMLTNKNIYRKVFDKIVLVQPKTSRSSLVNDIFEKLPEDQVFEKIDYSVVDKIKEIRSEFDKKSSSRKRNQLLILDDVTSQLKEDPSILIELSTNRRHLRLSIILLVQFTMSIPKSCRLQVSDIVLFKPNNGLEEDIIRSEFANLRSDEFKKLFRFVYRNPYDFLFINKNTETYYKNLQKIKNI